MLFKVNAKADGTSTSLGLEMNPSKSGLGFDFILLCLVLLGGLGDSVLVLLLVWDSKAS